jgi:hypothetical protein
MRIGLDVRYPPWALGGVHHDVAHLVPLWVRLAQDHDSFCAPIDGDFLI